MRGVAVFESVAQAAAEAAHGALDVYLIAAQGAALGTTILPLITDGDGEFARRTEPAGRRRSWCDPTDTSPTRRAGRPGPHWTPPAC